MSLNRYPKSDRRIITVLLGGIVLLTILLIYHSHSATPATATADTRLSRSDWRDSIALLKAQRQAAKERREQRYLEIKDSFAQLKAMRELQKQLREQAYLAKRDSFAQLKALREKKKAEQEALWQARQDSIQKLRPQKLKEGETLDLNLADSVQLMQVPGIGTGLANAILRYRDQLGGFCTKEQVLEVSGIPETILPYLIVSTLTTRKLEINRLTISQLRRHPYINFYQAKAIWEYRQKYGKIKDLKQLSLLSEFPEQAITRLLPYIKY